MKDKIFDSLNEKFDTLFEDINKSFLEYCKDRDIHFIKEEDGIICDTWRDYIKALDLLGDMRIPFKTFDGGSKKIILDKQYLQEKIVKKGNQWQVQSEKGRNMGTYDTKEEAEKRLQQVHYFKYKNEELNEDTRTTLIAKSRNAGDYKDQSKGKNRFERKKYSRVASAVKEYNQIDMNDFFKKDILTVKVPVTGETDSYIVSIKLEGIVAEIQKEIKANKNQLEFKTIIQSLTKIFNTGNVYVNCNCPDYLYNFDHWNIINNVATNDTAHDPGPGKNIRNPKDDKGRGCKHVLLVLANGDWMMKVASVIKNYIFYAEEHMKQAFDKLIFPKLYNTTVDSAIETDLVPEDTNLETEKHIIEKINTWAKNRGKIQKGSNKNPVAGKGKLSGPEEKTEEENK